MGLNEKFELHDTLNPKLWDSNNNLLEDVKARLIDIVEQFKSTIDIPLNIADVHLVGSNCNYNYTDKSDLDVHIISNFELLDASPELLQSFYNTAKSKFNADYDIKIRGIDIELYVMDINSTVTSNGIYSLMYDEWLKFPQKLMSIPEIDVSTEYAEWESAINSALSSRSSNAVVELINNIYIVRKTSLETEGEYGRGNQLFKELRNNGLLDELKSYYKKFRSKELSLEHLALNEDSRSKLLTKSKQSKKGMQRFKRRVKSRVANTVKQYNSIDMNKLFKQDILTVDIHVNGETDDYEVKISFGGFLMILKDQLEKQEGKFNLKAVTRALVIGFNKDDVYIHCSCPDWKYRYAYYATRNQLNSGAPENRPSNITNPNDTLGSGCKHVLLVLSNTSWILKVASTIFNYVNYMEKHYNKLYADIIYPAIYGKKYEEPVQMDMFSSDDELDSTTDTIDASNKYAADKNKFKKGNTDGIRFASKPDEQIGIDDEEDAVDEPNEDE
jgi:hypothetical protein